MKIRRMAYIAPALDSDLIAMAEDIKPKGGVNAILEEGARLLVEAWRRGDINDGADLVFNVIVKRGDR